MISRLAASSIWSGLYGDKELATLFTDSAELRAMLVVEGALAIAQAEVGLIPKEAAKSIQRAALDVVIDPHRLAAGTATAGVPVPALVEAFRAEIPDRETAHFVHWGATSQDILDTALVLRLRRVLEILEARLATLTNTLADQAEAHRTTVMAARTRGQMATPTTFGARIASWGMPLLRHRQRLAEMRPRLLQVSLGGASGTRSAMGGQGRAVEAALARGLGLAPAVVPWHSARDTVFELGSWAGLVTGSLGKMGRDLMHLAQSEVAEVQAGTLGGSSTMPHKRNPVGAELLVQLAGGVGPALAGLVQAMPHESERDGVAWAQEWMHLPPLLQAAGRALLGAQDLASSLSVDVEAMTAHLSKDNGAMFAEAAAFALAATRPRPQAVAEVKAALVTARAEGRGLREVLQATDPEGADWARVFDPLTQAGEALEIADHFLGAARNFTS